MKDLELFLVADCRQDGLANPTDCACPPCYLCHAARKEIRARGIDLAAMRRKVEIANARLRELDDDELFFLSVGVPCTEDRAIRELARREHRRRKRGE